MKLLIASTCLIFALASASNIDNIIDEDFAEFEKYEAKLKSNEMKSNDEKEFKIERKSMKQLFVDAAKRREKTRERVAELIPKIEEIMADEEMSWEESVMTARDMMWDETWSVYESICAMYPFVADKPIRKINLRGRGRRHIGDGARPKPNHDIGRGAEPHRSYAAYGNANERPRHNQGGHQGGHHQGGNHGGHHQGGYRGPTYM